MVNAPAIGCLRTDCTAVPSTHAATIFTAPNGGVEPAAITKASRTALATLGYADPGDWSDTTELMLV